MTNTLVAAIFPAFFGGVFEAFGLLGCYGSLVVRVYPQRSNSRRRVFLRLLDP